MYRQAKEKDEVRADRVYAQLEVAQQEKTEQSRQVFFDKLNGFQLANDRRSA